MKKYIKLAVLVVPCFLAGCLWGPKPAAPQKAPPDNRVVDSARLEKGGDLLIIPFRPGVGVEATDEVNRVALMAVKGISEVIKENETSFRLLGGEEAQKADFVVKGDISRFEKSSRLKKWLLIPKQATIEIKGKMVEQESGKVVLYFAQQVTSKIRERDLLTIGYDIGRKIGKFLLQE